MFAATVERPERSVDRWHLRVARFCEDMKVLTMVSTLWLSASVVTFLGTCLIIMVFVKTNCAQVTNPGWELTVLRVCYYCAFAGVLIPPLGLIWFGSTLVRNHLWKLTRRPARRRTGVHSRVRV